MRKTTIEITCDDCGQKIQGQENNISYNDKTLDFCSGCIYDRVKHSLNITPLGRQCPECNGKGRVKELINNHDTDWVTCNRCHGDKIIMLIEGIKTKL